MKLDALQLFKLALITVVGWAATVAVGLIVYGGDVFRPSSVAFAFLSYGLSGAFIFAFYHVRNVAETIMAAVIVSAAQFVVHLLWFPWLNALVWSYGVNMPVVALAFMFERKLAHFKQAKFTVVALVYSVMFVLLTLLVAVLGGVEMLPASLFRDNWLDGLLIGLGLGLGVEGAESFIHSWEEHRSDSAQERAA
ncbi:MAG TPA: hypothetical protein VNL69_00225 [Bacteroidota bacterium]|nr:hypothetical protein [Bacteroidota bacterium]